MVLFTLISLGEKPAMFIYLVVTVVGTRHSMANSASSGGTMSSSSRLLDGNKFCTCGVNCKLQTSWTEKNPGRRFFGCGNYGSVEACNFFSWYDPPTSERATKILWSIMQKNEKLKQQIEGQKREICALQVQLQEMSAQVLELTVMKDSYKSRCTKFRCVIGIILCVLFGKCFF
ncbi:Zinc finger, GRF-type [Sesbania bispinosa]|nr:Zinc finger, GRF-type [Sesbania bispinosa]